MNTFIAKLPPMLYGTAWKKENTARCVALALSSGFRGIDTACQPKHYEEALVGEGLEHFYSQGGRRDELFLQTKYTPLAGQDPSRIPYDPNASLEEQIFSSANVSKRHLHTDYLDALLLHSPLFPYAKLRQAWRALETLVDNGDVKYIGISNCYDLALLQRLQEEARIQPSIVQNRFYQDSGYDIALRAWCLETNIVYESFWSLTANPHLLHSALLHHLAQQYGYTPEHVLYRYLVHKKIVPLNGTTSEEHMKEDLSIFTMHLKDQEIEQIDALIASMV